MANVCNRCYIKSKHYVNVSNRCHIKLFVIVVILSQNIVNVCNRCYIKSKQCKRLQSL